MKVSEFINSLINIIKKDVGETADAEPLVRAIRQDFVDSWDEELDEEKSLAKIFKIMGSRVLEAFPVKAQHRQKGMMQLQQKIIKDCIAKPLEEFEETVEALSPGEKKTRLEAVIRECDELWVAAKDGNFSVFRPEITIATDLGFSGKESEYAEFKENLTRATTDYFLQLAKSGKVFDPFSGYMEQKTNQEESNILIHDYMKYCQEKHDPRVDLSFLTRADMDSLNQLAKKLSDIHDYTKENRFSGKLRTFDSAVLTGLADLIDNLVQFLWDRKQKLEQESPELADRIIKMPRLP